MKFMHLIAAALMFIGVGVSTEASAQRRDGYSQIDRRDDYRNDRRDRDRGRYDRRDNRRYDRHDNRRYDRYDRRDDRRWRGNNGRHNGWNNNRRPCRVIYRNHRRVTVCR